MNKKAERTGFMTLKILSLPLALSLSLETQEELGRLKSTRLDSGKTCLYFETCTLKVVLGWKKKKKKKQSERVLTRACKGGQATRPVIRGGPPVEECVWLCVFLFLKFGTWAGWRNELDYGLGLGSPMSRIINLSLLFGIWHLRDLTNLSFIPEKHALVLFQSGESSIFSPKSTWKLKILSRL